MREEHVKLFGLGFVFDFMYRYFLPLRLGLFLLGCFFQQYGVTIFIFLSILIEITVIWCRFKAPVLDLERREEFIQYLDDALMADGGETVNCLNQFMDNGWKRVFDEKMINMAAEMGRECLNGYAPGFISDIQVKNLSFGTKPFKIVQMITEKPIYKHSVQYDARCVMSNEIYFEVHCKCFNYPMIVTFTRPVSFFPMRFIIEAPKKNPNLYLPIFSSVDATAIEKIKMLSSKTYVNGFEITKVPMLGFLMHYFMEQVMANSLANGEAAGWDWITNEIKWRHVTRPCTQYSKDIFSSSAEMDKQKTEPLPRFSQPNKKIAKFEKSRKLDWDMLYETKLNPNERLIFMEPEYTEPIDPIFTYNEVDNTPKAVKEIQTTDMELIE